RQRSRLAAGELTNQGSGARWLGAGRPQAVPAQTKPKFLDYCWLKLTDVALAGAWRVLRTVSERVKAVVDALQAAQLRLQSFEELFLPALGTADVPANQPSGNGDHLIELLPGGTRDLVKAGQWLVEEVGSQLCDQLNETIQAEVLNPRGGLWKLVSDGADL